MTPDGHGATPDRIIESLRSARARKSMRLTVVEGRAAENFLSGFDPACAACGFALPYGGEIRKRATLGRGWTWTAAGPVGEMRGRGLSDAEVVDEWLAVEIAAREARRDGPA